MELTEGFKYQTANGTPIIIYNMAAGGTQCIHGAYWSGPEEEWVLIAWEKEGKFQGNRKHPMDIDWGKTKIVD
jgi:purine nucleoside permease